MYEYIIKNNRVKIIIKAVLTFLLILSSVLSFCIGTINLNTYAGGMPDQLSEEGQKNAEEVWKFLRGEGFSEESIAGILGNADQENGCEAPLDPNATYTGFFCMSQDQVANCREWCAKNDHDVTTAVGQVAFLLENSWESDFSTFGTKMGLDEFKKLDDVILATDEFCAAYERCVGGTSAESKPYNGEVYQELYTREKYAEAFFELYTGTVAGEDDKEGEETEDDAVSLGILGEGDIIDINRLDESAIELPSVEDLGVFDRISISEWSQNIANVKSDKYYAVPRRVFVFVGILLTVWAILLYLGYWVDRINTIIPYQVLPILTLGIFRISPDDLTSTYNDRSSTQRVINHSNTLTICLIGIAIGILLISQRVNYMVNEMIMVIMDLL